MKSRKTRIVVPKGYTGETTRMRRRTRKQRTGTGLGTAMTVVFWAVAVMSVGVVLDVAGPLAGWTEKVFGQTGPGSHAPPSTHPAASQQAPTARQQEINDEFLDELVAEMDWQSNPGSDISEATGHVASPGSAVRETASSEALRERLQLLYEDKYQEHLDQLGVPCLGKTCTITLRDGQMLEGVLLSLEPDQVTLRLKHGTFSLPVSRLNNRSREVLFPERKARQLAMRDMRRLYGQALSADFAGESTREKGARL